METSNSIGALVIITPNIPRRLGESPLNGLICGFWLERSLRIRHESRCVSISWYIMKCQAILVIISSRRHSEKGRLRRTTLCVSVRCSGHSLPETLFLAFVSSDITYGFREDLFSSICGVGLDGDTKQKNKDKKNLESCGGGFQYIYPKQRYI